MNNKMNDLEKREAHKNELIKLHAAMLELDIFAGRPNYIQALKHIEEVIARLDNK